MGALTYIALAYGALFVLSFTLGIPWITPIVGLFGVFLIIALSVKLDSVDKDTEKNTVVLNELIHLTKEVEELKNERITVKRETMRSIFSGLEDAKYEVMIKTLVNRSRNKGFLNPELSVEDAIKEKMATGKTKEQAIEELYKQE